MQSVVITLAAYEIQHAAQVAVSRQLSMWNRQQRALHGQDSRGNNWQYQITGALGELAVAKYLGIYWDTPTLDDRAGELPDVGPFEVRATEHHPAHLYVHDYDRQAPYLLAIVKRDRVKLAGWAYKADVEGAGQYCPTPTHPTWKLHQDHLRPISELPERPN